MPRIILTFNANAKHFLKSERGTVCWERGHPARMSAQRELFPLGARALLARNDRGSSQTVREGAVLSWSAGILARSDRDSRPTVREGAVLSRACGDTVCMLGAGARLHAAGARLYGAGAGMHNAGADMYGAGAGRGETSTLRRSSRSRILWAAAARSF